VIADAGGDNVGSADDGLKQGKAHERVRTGRYQFERAVVSEVTPTRRTKTTKTSFHLWMG
jgi:hypothetical protein